MTPQSVSGATFGLGVLSSAISGYGKIEEGQQQKSAYDYNADVAILNASEQGVATEQKFDERIGKQAASYAASGVDIASGSPLLIMTMTALRKGQQEKQIMEAGNEQATLDRYYGKMAAFSGTMSGIGSFLSGVSSAATAYTKATFNPVPSVRPASAGGYGSYDSGD